MGYRRDESVTVRPVKGLAVSLRSEQFQCERHLAISENSQKKKKVSFKLIFFQRAMEITKMGSSGITVDREGYSNQKPSTISRTHYGYRYRNGF